MSNEEHPSTVICVEPKFPNVIALNGNVDLLLVCMDVNGKLVDQKELFKKEQPTMPIINSPELKTVTVPADKLYHLLRAFKGAPHEIRELMITRNLPCRPGNENPIDALEAAYDDAIIAHCKAIRDAEQPVG